MPICPKCGTNVADANATFCPNCGTNLSTTGMSSAPSVPPQPVSVPPPPPSWTSGLVPPVYSGVDRQALGDLKTFALLGIVGIIISVASIFSSNISGIMTANSATLGSAVATGIAVAILAIVGFVIGIIALFKARAAFKNLATVDRGFSTPAKLVLVFFLGLVFFILVFVVLAAAIGLAISSVSSGSVSPGLAAAIGVILLFAGIGIICFIIGAIGVILGLWRAGSRYSEDMIKIGGILYIIPVVDIAAPILVYIGVNSALNKLPPTV
jgi:hypothetical protein